MTNILSIGVSGLNAFQAMISTTAHNISNSATDGFSRQETTLVTRTPQQLGGTLIGSGVRIGMTERVVDDMLNDVHRNNIAELSHWSTQQTLADQLRELATNEDTGVANSIDRFFSALQQLSTQVPSTQHRQVLLSETESFVKRVNTFETRLNNLTNDVESQTTELVEKINSISESLLKVNNDITVAKNLGTLSYPNDLLDLRGKLLDDLAKLVEVTTVSKNDGGLDIFIGAGLSLLVGNNRTIYDTGRNSTDLAQLDIRIKSANNSHVVVTENMVGGQIGGLREFKNNLIEPSRARLGQIIMTFAMTFNAQHKLGIDANGDLGEDYFNDFNTLSLQLSRALPDYGNTGNGIIAVSIDEIKRPAQGPYTLISTSGNLVDTGTLDSIKASDLKINGINITAAVAGDDSVSSADNAASAIAMAKTINASTNGTNVTAKAEQNLVYLGAFTTGAYASGEFAINQVNIVTTGSNVEVLLADINAMSAQTGVIATKDRNNAITLVAEDGRNIQLTSNTTATTANFANFNTASTTALDKVQRAAISLTHIDSPIVITGNLPAHAGLTQGTTPAPVSSLTDSDYELTYNGNLYQLLRLQDKQIVATSLTPDISADGFTINLNNGTIRENDRFIIRPTIAANSAFAMKIKRVDKIAMSSPIRVQSDINNSGTGVILRGKVLNTSGIPASSNTFLGNAFPAKGKLSPPIRIEFVADAAGQATRYRVYDVSNGVPGVQIGADKPFMPNQNNEIFPMIGIVDSSLPGPNPPVNYDPGYRITIAGAPAVGDSFNVEYNADAVSDDGNAQELLALKNENLLFNAVSYQGAYSQMVTRIGSISQTIEVNRQAGISLTRETEARKQSISGVNLDEEAAKLIRFQQAYRAAAQVVSVGGSLFDSLLTALRG